MATPQKPDPNDPLRDLATNETQNIVDRGGTGRGLWIWLVIAAVIVAIIWVAWWGWTYRGGGRGTATGAGPVSGPPGNNGLVNDPQRVPPANGPAAPANSHGTLTGSGVPALTAQDKRAFVGRAFEVRSVPVQESPSNGVVWVGETGSTPTLVVLARTGKSETSTVLGRGNLVDVTGALVKAPSVAQARHDWSLSPEGAQQLEQEGAYVRATQVQPAVR